MHSSFRWLKTAISISQVGSVDCVLGSSNNIVPDMCALVLETHDKFVITGKLTCSNVFHPPRHVVLNKYVQASSIGQSYHIILVSFRRPTNFINWHLLHFAFLLLGLVSLTLIKTVALFPYLVLGH